MPSAADHSEWASRNEKLFSELGASSGNWPDWCMTLLFYAALHEIMSTLTAQRSALAISLPRTHADRRGLLRQRWPDIATTYDALYGWSRRARYDCWLPAKFQIDLAAQQLVDLRQKLTTI